MKIQKGLKFFAVIFVGLLAMEGCKNNGNSSSSGTAEAVVEEIRIGEFGSMTGTEATFGISTHRGIQMVIDAVNAEGGVKGKKLKLITYDDAGKPEEAVTAVTKLITQDKVDIILGEVASSRSLAAAPVAQRYKVPMITPSSTNPKVTEVGDYIFRVCFTDPFQGKVLAKFAAEDLKAKTAAILIDKKSDYSVGLADFFRSTFVAAGGKIVKEQNYVGGDIDFKAQLTSLKGLNPEVVVVPGYYTEVGLIMKQAKELGLKTIFLGGDGWDSPKLFEIGGVAINGSYMTNHYTTDDKDPRVQDFIAKYKEKFGEVPDGLAAMGYDAALVFIDAVKRAPDTSKLALRDAIAATKSFPAVTGIISIDEQRNASKAAVILKVEELAFHFVKRIQP